MPGRGFQESRRCLRSRSPRAIWSRLAGIGFEFAAAVGGFTFAGCLWDRYFGTGPGELLIGAILGLIGGMYNLIRQTMRRHPGLRRGIKKRRRRIAMTASRSPAAAEYLRFLGWAVAVGAAAALLGYAPTRRLGGEGALPAMVAGCAIGVIASAVGALPVADSRGGRGRRARRSRG